MTDIVFVLELQDFTPGEYVGWTSVHLTYAGAQAKLREIARRWGIDVDEIDNPPAAADSDDYVPNESGWTYAISRLEVLP
jgi:predicted RNase H-like nuclease (RuvC/YqgF family)